MATQTWGQQVGQGWGMGCVTRMKINQGGLLGLFGVDSVSSTQLYFHENLKSQGL